MLTQLTNGKSEAYGGKARGKEENPSSNSKDPAVLTSHVYVFNIHEFQLPQLNDSKALMTQFKFQLR